MSVRVGGLWVALIVLFVSAVAFAQSTVAPGDNEKLAEAIFLQGEARMKLGAYEEAVTEFSNVLKRYPNTQSRYRAQFRMADALFQLRREEEGLALLDAVVEEKSAEWSPQALIKVGGLRASQEKWLEAIAAYRKVVAQYPDSPMVDRAHFSVGVIYYKQGRFEPAVMELDRVGTAYAARNPDMLKVSPGDPLYIRLSEPNLAAYDALKVEVKVVLSAEKSGDKVETALSPETEGSDRFSATVPTELGSPKEVDGAADTVLQLFGNDMVTLSFKSRYIGDGVENRELSLGTASNARVILRDGDSNEIRTAAVGAGLTIEVADADRDVTDKADTVRATIATKQGDQEKVVLTETGVHTGVFRIVLDVRKGKAQKESGAIETAEVVAEKDEADALDRATVSYTDEVCLLSVAAGARQVEESVPLIQSAAGSVKVPLPQIEDASMEIQQMLYKGRSLTEIGATYRDLAQEVKAGQSFRLAAGQFNELILKYPKSPEVEDAMFGLVQNYVAQDEFAAALGMIDQLMRKFPQSERGVEALMMLADLRVKREEYAEAMTIYQKIVASAGDTPEAEEAQYAICTTYLAMLKKAKATVTGGALVTPEEVIIAFDQFAQMFPQSDRAPDAMWQLIRFRFEVDDFNGVVGTARRMLAKYPDHELTGRALVESAKAQVKLNNRDEAMNSLRFVIANYGSQADVATALLNQLQRSIVAPTVG